VLNNLKTSLFEEHVALNAKIVDFAGWQMPIQYKNLKEEVLAVRENIGVFDVSHMGEFIVTGTDSINFVDYLVTNDIKSAPMGKAIYSPLCREDGTIIDDLIVYKIAEEKILICVNASNIDKDFTWIKSQIGTFNCEISNESEKYSLLAIQGPNSFKILKSIDLGFDLKDLDYYSIQVGTDNDTPVMVARTGYTGEDGFELFGPHLFIKKLWKNLMDKGVTPCGLGARDVLRLEVCFPLYGHELDDNVTPLDAGLKWTVKLKKDKFIGKDILSNYNPKYKLLKLELEKGIPREGYIVEDENGNNIGHITSGTMSVITKKGIAFARVKSEYLGDIFNIDIRGKKYPANLVKKPFVVGGHK